MKNRGRTVLICALLAVAIGGALKFGLSTGKPGPDTAVVDQTAVAPAPALANQNAAAAPSVPGQAVSADAAPTPVPQIHSAAEFATLTDEVLHSLPQLKALQGLNDEAVHNTPDIIREAGVALGQVAQLVHDNPAYEEAGVHFYNECTLQTGGINSIRALCFANLKKLSIKLKLPLDNEKYPADVRRLAVHILDE